MLELELFSSEIRLERIKNWEVKKILNSTWKVTKILKILL